MPKVAKIHKPLAPLIAIFVLGVAADQGSKYAARQSLLDEVFFERESEHAACTSMEKSARRRAFFIQHRQDIRLIDGLFDLSYAENCGAAFSLLRNTHIYFRIPFFGLILLAAVFFVPYIYRKVSGEQRLLLYGLPFLLAGAVGNGIDRLCKFYVVDFLKLYIRMNGKEYTWPIFNIADIFILVGMGLLLFQMVSTARNSSRD